MKKTLIILLILLINISFVNAEFDTDLLNDIWDITDGENIEIGMEFELNKLYPYDDSQTKVYSKALSHFKYDFATRHENDRTYYLSSLNFADKNIFSNIDLNYNGKNYTLNTLLNNKILKTTNSLPIFDIFNFTNPFTENKIFSTEKASEDIQNIVKNLDDTEEKKRVSFTVKGFTNPYKQSSINISNSNIDKYSQILKDIISVGLEDEYIKSLDIKTSNRYMLRILYDKEDNVQGIRLKGQIFTGNDKREINSTIDFDDNKLQIDNVLSINKQRYIQSTLYKDKLNNTETLVSKQKDKNNSIVLEENKNFDIKKDAEQNKLYGEYKYTQSIESDDKVDIKTIELHPDIYIDKNDNKRYIRGALTAKYSANDVDYLDIGIKFSPANNIQSSYDISKIFDVSIENGGIDKNITYFDKDTKLIDIDKINKDSMLSLLEELKQSFSAKTLRVMLEEDDHSEYILSYGMQPEDWKEFLEYYKSLEE